MFSFKLKYVFKAISCVIYVSLLYLGCYFISEGKVWERFQHKKTSFAEYTELLTELPSLITWIDYTPAASEYLSLGVDFNITWYSGWSWDGETALKEGENNISGLILMLSADYDAYCQEAVVTPTSNQDSTSSSPPPFSLTSTCSHTLR